MSNRIIEMFEYRVIINRLRQGQSDRGIAADGLAGRRKIRDIRLIAQDKGWLSADVDIPSEVKLADIFKREFSKLSTSKAAVYYDQIQAWVKQGLNAKCIHQHLGRNHGFSGAYNSVQRLVKKIRDQLPPDLTVPLHFSPGEAAQVDFGKGPRLLDLRTGKIVDTWFFVMTLCFSRHQYAELVVHQDIETWLTCHQNAFNWFGGVPKKVIIDNPKCAITKACYHDPEVQRSYEELALDYGFLVSACPPADPQKKGRVESGVKYIKGNFMPLRDFLNLQDANKQLKHWVLQTAGNRNHGSTFCKPLSSFTELEQKELKALPSNQPEIAVSNVN